MDGTGGEFHRHASLRDRGADLAFEAVGGPTFQSSLRTLRPGGRLVLVGNVTVATVPLRLGPVLLNDLEIIGSDSCTAAELLQVFAFLQTTGLRPHIAQVLPLDAVAQAHQMLEERQAQGRIVLKLAAADWS